MGDILGEIPVGDEQEPERITDAEALDRIARLMSGVEWDSDLPCEVADVVRATGREIEEPVVDEAPGHKVCPHGYEDEERLICPSCAAEAMVPPRDD